MISKLIIISHRRIQNPVNFEDEKLIFSTKLSFLDVLQGAEYTFVAVALIELYLV